MAIQKIPETDHVLRLVPWSKLRKDENDNVIGIEAVAFELRKGEVGLSCTWIEFFKDQEGESLHLAIGAVRNSNLRVGRKAGFAVGNVSEIKGACAGRGCKIRIVHAAKADNVAHAEVLRLNCYDLELLESLANGCWSNLIMNSEIAS